MATQEERYKGAWVAPEIEHNKLTPWNWTVGHPEGLELGKWTDIGAFTYIQAQYGVTIEDEVQIGAHCAVYSISTISPTDEPIIGKVTIKKGAMIGAQSTIMPGVTIGEGAIVGAHSLVKDDVPDGAMVVGAPARRIR